MIFLKHWKNIFQLDRLERRRCSSTAEIRQSSSVAERILGKNEVAGSIPASGLSSREFSRRTFYKFKIRKAGSRQWRETLPTGSNFAFGKICPAVTK